MAQLPFIAAIDAGIHQEMRRDPSVLYFGQNLATTENHPNSSPPMATIACA